MNGTIYGVAFGGAGGGGNGALFVGSIPFPPTAGTSNTGGGGGGSSGDNTANGYLSAAGGSGIVIIRYPQNCSAPVATTGNPQILYNNGYQIYIWTTSGTVTF
jgi:hypothetical protein